MLHEVATGGVNRTNIMQPVREMICRGNNEFIEAEVQGVDFERKQVLTSLGEVSYDYLVLSLGSSINFFNVPGAAEHAMGLKTIDDATRIRNRALWLMEASVREPNEARRRELLRWIIVGGGPAGVELAAELRDFAESYDRVVPWFNLEHLDIQIHQAGECLLPMFDERMRQAAEQILTKRKISIKLKSTITGITDQNITVGDQTIPTQLVIWTAGVCVLPLQLKPEGMAGPDHRFAVTDYLNLPRFPEVFVVGDQAKIATVPQTAQATVAEAHIAGKNIVASIHGKRLTPFHFYKKGDLVSLGRWQAIGVIGPVYVRGPLAWLIWRGVYLSKLVGVPNRIRVAIDWALGALYPRDLNEA